MPRRRALTAMTAVALLLVGLGTTTAHADGVVTDLYVSSGPPCTDSGTGTMTAPYCTLQAAADAVVAGQTVHISGTSSVFPVVLSKSGTANAPITFAGWPSSGTISLATMNASDPRAGQPMITFRNAQYVNLKNLILRPGANTSLSLVNAQHIGIDQITQQGSVTSLPSSAGPDGAIDIDGASSYVSILHSVTEYTAGDGIRIASGAQHIVLASDGIEAPGAGVRADGVKDLELAGDTTLASGGGVVITGSSSGSVENTVMMPNRLDQAGPPAISVSADSTGGVTEDYNSVTADKSHLDYDWGGTTYASSAAMHTATGQGLHDVDTLPGPGIIPAEGSPLIDSGDADAPGESATDLHGHPRVDDPTVPNTGTGSGYVDRGALEYQDRYSVSAATTTATPAEQTYPLSVTTTTSVGNPWSDGVTYSYDYGDGTEPTVTRDPTNQQHTYTKPPADNSGGFTVKVTATRDSGTSTISSQRIAALNEAPLVTSYTWASTEAHPDQAGIATIYDDSTDPYKITEISTDWGDGSAPTVSSPENLTPTNDNTVQHSYARPGVHSAVQTVTDAAGRTSTTSIQVVTGTAYSSYSSPERILDTRSGLGATKRRIGPGEVLRLRIAGTSAGTGAPPAAVTLNVTDTNATADSWVAAYPDGTARPTTSNLNFRAGQTNPNLVTIPVGADGYIDLYNADGYVDLIADIQGTYDATPSNSGHDSTFLPHTPTRVLDTRSGIGVPAKPAGPGSTTTVTLPSSLVDSGTTAVMVNLTATQATAGSWIAAYPGDGTLPSTSNLNFSAGQTTSNLVVIPVDSSHEIKFYNRAGQTAVIADVLGTYTDKDLTGSFYVPVTPTRLVDTRSGLGTTKQRLGANSTLRIKVTGTHGIPAGATAVTVNLTGTGPSAGTYLTAYGDGTPPNASNINLVSGQTRPVLATVPIGTDGYITIYNRSGSIDVIADLQGYYAP